MTTFEALNIILVFLVPLTLIPSVVLITRFFVLRKAFKTSQIFKDLVIKCPQDEKTFNREGLYGLISGAAFIVLTILCLVI